MPDNVYHESSALSSIIVKSRLVSIQDPQGQMPADLSEVCGDYPYLVQRILDTE